MSAPKAVLEMEFFLSKESPARAEILMRKRYAKAIPVNGRSAEALVKGWDQALSEIIVALVADLQSNQLLDFIPTVKLPIYSAGRTRQR